MYKIKVKDSIYTIPKQNIRLLALSKVVELGHLTIIKDDAGAIAYLKELGVEFLEGLD